MFSEERHLVKHKAERKEERQEGQAVGRAGGVGMGVKASQLCEGLLAAHRLHWDGKVPFQSTHRVSLAFRGNRVWEVRRQTVVTEAVDSASVSYSEETNLSVYSVRQCTSRSTLVRKSVRKHCLACQQVLLCVQIVELVDVGESFSLETPLK